jgi:Holliday junction DNA helicase RuvA
MIGRLRGTVLERAPGRLLLDVAGVGYELRIPLSTFYALERAEQPVSVHVHTRLRDDALELFGFASEGERELFLRLVGISGVGPRTALGILSGIGPDELREAVWRQDRARLVKIPGVGKKTAERLLLELRDALGLGAADAPPTNGCPARIPAAGTVAGDATSALTNLGYAPAVAGRAVERALGELPGGRLEDVLRRALAVLAR